MKNPTLKNLTIVGGKRGISVAPGASAGFENITFDNVETPFEIESAASIEMTGTKIINDPKNRTTARTRTSSGWRRPSGPPLPAFCPQCKQIFASKNYVFGGQFYSLWDNSEECPSCGHEAKLSEGTFNLSAEMVKVISAPDLTYAMLRAISEISEDLLMAKITTSEAIKLAEQAAPSYAKILKAAISHGAAVVVFLAAAATIAAYPLLQEQTRIAREGLEVAKKQPPQDDLSAQNQRLLETILQAMSHYTCKPENSGRSQLQENNKNNSTNPSHRKPPAKS